MRNAIQTYFLCLSASSHQTFSALEILFLRIIVTAILTVHLVNSFCHIGKLQSIQEKPYEPGQLVINRLFGCRAIIMKYWKAKLVEKNLALGNVDIPKENDNVDAQPQSESDLESLANPPGPKAYIHGYSLLLDMSDATSCNYYYSGSTYIPDPDLRSEIRNERGETDLGPIVVPAVTERKSPQLCKQVDYAFHEDLIPYTSFSVVPVKNPLLTELFHYHPERRKYLPSVVLDDFILSLKPALEMRTVYRQTTHGVRVTVVPFFLGAIDSDFYWRYIVRIENLTSESLTLRERFWKIYSMKGKLETVSGKGVIGKEPVLTTSTPVFQYHSHTITRIPSTYMWGVFRFQKPSGATIDVKIPNVALKYTLDEEKESNKVPETDPEPTDK
ncbi:hypothetical protein ACTXT7_006576 [Hymenolepis weldensis]